MKLRDWCELNGVSLTKVMQRAGVAYTTALRARDSHVSYDTAKKISAVTGGEVSIAELCERVEESETDTEAA